MFQVLCFQVYQPTTLILCRIPRKLVPCQYRELTNLAPLLEEHPVLPKGYWHQVSLQREANTLDFCFTRASRKFLLQLLPVVSKPISLWSRRGASLVSNIKVDQSEPCCCLSVVHAIDQSIRQQKIILNCNVLFLKIDRLLLRSIDN